MTRTILVFVVAAIGLSGVAQAQIRASERAAVTQTVDGTTITMDYSRLHVRGRDTLFGGVVPWGKVWTGANWATTIEVNRDITIDGYALATGVYSVWFEVQPEEWTVIFDPEPRRFHLFPPQPSDEQIRFPVRPTEYAHTELLTWEFRDVRPTGTTLQLAWGTTGVSFDIGVSPSRPVTVAEGMAKRYVGSYRLGLRPPLGSEEVPFDIRYENEHLVATWESAPNPNLRETWLVSLGEGMFAIAELHDGELFDVVVDLVLEFPLDEGKATGFEMRALGDELWATAERSP
jgi:hypothetical protein